MALINPGDDVLLEKPCWVSFPEIVKFAQGNVVWIETEATDFHLTAAQVKASLTPRTKLLIVNSPSNPTGRVIAPEEFQKIVEVAAAHDIWVISDECYLQLVYPPLRPFSAAALPPELRARVLIAGSLSKTYAMTGWRVGYTLGLREWVTEVLKVQSQSATHTSSISQKAAITALTASQAPVAEMLAEYQRRAAWLIPALNAVPGIVCSPPEGAFYAFPNVKQLMSDGGFTSSKEVAHELLYQHAVVVTDGAAFGAEGYLRLSFANSLDAIQEAVRRMQQMVSSRRK
jgi:aspartate aminotransferase